MKKKNYGKKKIINKKENDYIHKLGFNQTIVKNDSAGSGSKNHSKEPPEDTMFSGNAEIKILNGGSQVGTGWVLLRRGMLSNITYYYILGVQFVSFFLSFYYAANSRFMLTLLKIDYLTEISFQEQDFFFKRTKEQQQRYENNTCLYYPT